MVRVEVPGHVLQHFWDLANVQADVRQKSAVSLVTELKSAQDAHGPDGADVEMGDADAGAGAGGVVAHGVGALGSRGYADAPALTECSPVLTYALKRLARGLGSGRSGARQGFALALTAAFAEIPLVTLPDGLKLLKSSLEPITQSTKGSEARDILMGQLFGVAALVRAMAARLGSGDLGADETVDLAVALAEEVSALAASKTYLAESAAAVVLELHDVLEAHLPDGEAAFARVVDRAPALRAWLEKPAEAAGPETVSLALRLWRAMPDAVLDACDVLPDEAKRAAREAADGRKKGPPKKGKKSARAGSSPALPWPSVLSAAHLEKLRPALMASSFAHPQVHTVWRCLLDGAGGVPGALETLWEVAVENGLMASGSHQRRFLGFRLFAEALPRAGAAEIPALFSDNFTRCLLNNLNKPDNYLHAAAMDCLDRVVQHAKAASATAEQRLAIITALQRLGPNRFDKISKAGAVLSLIHI